MKAYHVAAALIRRENQVLLVHQQGPGDPAPLWALPGGLVEAGELLPEALRREVHEETGLKIHDPGRLLYVAQLHDPSPGTWSTWTQGEIPAPGDLGTAFVFAIEEWSGNLDGVDPDNFVSKARFLPVDEAIEKLSQLPWRQMHEPIVAYLRGEVGPGAMWFYRRHPDRGEELVTQTPGLI